VIRPHIRLLGQSEPKASTVSEMALSPISRAWLTAGAELGIRVEAPAVVVLGGASVECVAYLPDFGSSSGAATFARSAKPELVKAAGWRSIPLCSR